MQSDEKQDLYLVLDSVEDLRVWSTLGFLKMCLKYYELDMSK